MIDHYALAALVGAGLSDSQTADALGVSTRTVRRARARYGIASTWTPAAPLCGTLAAYRRGCRCLPCRAASAAQRRRYRQGVTVTA